MTPWPDEPGTTRADPWNLDRFLHAQGHAWSPALAEVRAGRKQSHWMWFVFPQCAGLGSSPMAKRFAIQSLAEARAYLEHPVLGPRLREISEAALAVEGRSARELMGSPDDLKLRSCATLFASISPQGSVFHRLLEKYFEGPDPRTEELMRQGG
jgi:uncharacterized protein (DUF1810 family)